MVTVWADMAMPSKLVQDIRLQHACAWEAECGRCGNVWQRAIIVESSSPDSGLFGFPIPWAVLLARDNYTVYGPRSKRSHVYDALAYSEFTNGQPTFLECYALVCRLHAEFRQFYDL